MLEVSYFRNPHKRHQLRERSPPPMQNPFPGMNPYLEQPGLWPQVHSRLIVAIADEITPQVAPKYRVSIEERIYTTTDTDLLVGIADVAIALRSETGSQAATTAQLTAPRRVQVPLPMEVNPYSMGAVGRPQSRWSNAGSG
ncbi:MAG: DUF4058 family protein [Synechococcales bacterium]|nr:DUF4058 family protein [Synechococcales bacterium]